MSIFNHECQRQCQGTSDSKEKVAECWLNGGQLIHESPIGVETHFPENAMHQAFRPCLPASAANKDGELGQCC